LLRAVPSIMKLNAKLLEIAEEFAAFLALSDPADLASGHAEWGWGRLRDLVGQLSEPERREFVAFIHSRHDRASGDYRTFLEELPRRLRLD
jgi:hypothetical protein